MVLPGRLRKTTLGDVLGTLHRAAVYGVLELTEDRGRCHRIHLANGLVVAVEIDGASAPLGDMLRRDAVVEEETLRRSLLRAMASHRLLGEVLVTDFNVAPTVVGAALRRQIVQRLQVVEGLSDAQIRFRVVTGHPRSALGQPLTAHEFLRGRRRARDRSPASGTFSTSAPQDDRYAALYVLGLAAGADRDAIKQAYRRLARAYHPDLHPAASEAERRDLARQFAAVTTAYQRLVA
jgi:hypothetical protein